MDLKLDLNHYQMAIPQPVWQDFFEQFTQDNRGRLITLKILDRQMGDFEVLRHKALFSVAYEPPNYGNDLVVTVSHPSTIQAATYSHIIVCPQTLAIVTDQDGTIETCTVTDDDHAQTIICLES